MNQKHQLQFMVLPDPLEKANATADCLENQFTLYELYDENHERRVEDRDQALTEIMDNSSHERAGLVTSKN
jgi:hypothetical protein